MTSYYYDVLEPSVQQQGSHMIMKGVSKTLKEKCIEHPESNGQEIKKNNNFEKPAKNVIVSYFYKNKS